MGRICTRGMPRRFHSFFSMSMIMSFTELQFSGTILQVYCFLYIMVCVTRIHKWGPELRGPVQPD